MWSNSKKSWKGGAGFFGHEMDCSRFCCPWMNGHQVGKHFFGGVTCMATHVILEFSWDFTRSSAVL